MALKASTLASPHDEKPHIPSNVFLDRTLFSCGTSRRIGILIIGSKAKTPPFFFFFPFFLLQRQYPLRPVEQYQNFGYSDGPSTVWSRN